MANSTTGPGCKTRCWQIAAAIGVVALILMLVIGNQGLFAAIVMSVILAVILGLGLGYFFCGEAPASSPARQASETTPADKPQPEGREPDAAPQDTTAREPAGAATAAAKTAKAPAAASETDAPAWSGTQLPGEQELAARKGEWKYRGGAGADSKAPPAAGGGTRPEGLSEARAGGADDLKRIKGIGPKLEQALHSMGYYHYDQIAAWGPEEVAWVDENLKGFKGRVSRDNWVEQAKVLARGEKTEFSKRVEDGDVY